MRERVATRREADATLAPYRRAQPRLALQARAAHQPAGRGNGYAVDERIY